MKKKFIPIQETLKKILKDYGLNELFFLNYLKENWISILNPTIANVSKPTKLVNKKLVIETASELWKKEFKLQRETILEKINKKLDGYKIDEIEVI